MGCSPWLLAVVVSVLGGAVFGYELAVISGALLQLQLQFQLTCVRQEALVSSLLVGAILASVIGGWLIDRHGRRASILLGNLLIISGTLILCASSSFAMLMLGRALVGFAMSVSSMSCCIYVSEMVSAQRRGLMVTLYEVGVTTGILLAYAVNYALSAAQEGWRYMFGLAVAPAAVQLVSVWVLPPQPAPPTQTRSRHGDRGATPTRRTIASLFGREDNMRRRMLIGLGLVIFQQFSGQPNVLFYASTIFQSVGFRDGASAVLASLGLGVVKVAATLAAMLSADRVGRRPLLMGGCLVMAAGLILIGFLSRNAEFADKRCGLYTNTSKLTTAHTGSEHGLDAGPHKPVFDWFILICMMSVVAAFSVSFGPMTWVVLSEIFPADVRGRAFAFSSCFNWVANLIVTFSFLSVIDVVGLSGTFFVYGVVAAAAGVFVHRLLPETKGKSLQDIDRELRTRRFSNKDEFCGVFQRRRFTPGYGRLSWNNSAV